MCGVTADIAYTANGWIVDFEDTSQVDADTTITNWRWDFGDLTCAVVQNPTAIYTASGTYTVGLLVTAVDEDGNECTSEASITITINNAEPTLNADDLNNQSGDTVSITPNVTDPDGDPLEWVIEGLPNGLTYDSATGEITGTLTEVGSYTVSYCVDDGRGAICDSTFTWDVTAVEGCEVTVTGTQSRTIGQSPLVVEFQGFADLPPGKTELEWLWDFGDGTTSTEQNPTHTFANDGTYDVKLRVRAS